MGGNAVMERRSRTLSSPSAAIGNQRSIRRVSGISSDPCPCVAATDYYCPTKLSRRHADPNVSTFHRVLEPTGRRSRTGARHHCKPAKSDTRFADGSPNHAAPVYRSGRSEPRGCVSVRRAQEKTPHVTFFRQGVSASAPRREYCERIGIQHPLPHTRFMGVF